MALFNRNAILTGCGIDSFCLVCESHIRSYEHAVSHIAKQIHLKNLNAVSYLEKFKEDRVRKVLKGYYCELCNVLFSTAAKVSLHVTEAAHNNNKGIQSLKRVGNSVIAFNDICINEKSWNGLIGENCVICDTEFTNSSMHKASPEHILNLVEKKLEFAGSDIYRKVDDISLQCLTCNVIVSTSTITEHFNHDSHTVEYKNCREFNTTQILSADCETTEKDLQQLGQQIKDIRSSLSNTDCVEPKSFDGNKDVHIKTVTENIIDENQGSNTTNQVSIADSNANITDYNGATAQIQEAKAIKTTNVKKGKKNKSNNKNYTKKLRSNSDKEKRIDLQKKSVEYNIKPNIPDTLESEKDSTQKRGVKDKGTAKVVEITDEPENASNLALVSYEPVFERNITPTNQDITPEATVSRLDMNDPLIFANENKITYNKGTPNAFCRICSTRLPSSLRSMQEHVSGNAHKSKAQSVNKPKPKPKIPTKPTSRFVRDLVVFESPILGDAIINEKFCLGKLGYNIISQCGDRYRCQVCEINLVTTEVEDHMESESHEEKLDEVPLVWNMFEEFVREIRPEIYHCGYCNLIVGTWADIGKHLTCQEHRNVKAACRRRLECHMAAIRQHTSNALMRMFMLGQFR